MESRLLGRGLEARKFRLAITFLMPLFICYAAIVVYPFFKAIQLSLTDYNPLYPKVTYVWWENYIRLFREPEFHRTLLNTFIWTGGIVSAEFIFGFGIALLLNQQFKGRGVYRSLILIPWVVPAVCAAITWSLIYDPYYGFLNWVLRSIGLISDPVAWLAETRWALLACMVMRFWKGLPFVTIMLLAGLQAIPPELYEVARMDGASWGKRIRHITIPLVEPIALIAVMLVGMSTFKGFGEVFLLTKGGPGGATMLISVHGYLASFQFYKLGYGSAIGVITFLMLLVPMYLYLRYLKKRMR